VSGTVTTSELNPMLRAAFAVLDRVGVDWCVLRGEEELARPPGDVDLLIAPADRERACAALRSVGFSRVPAYGRGSHLFLRAYDGATDVWITLDVVTELAYGPAFSLATRAEHGCLRRRHRKARVNVLAPDDAFWTLLLHCVLDKRVIDTHHGPRLEALAEVALPDGPLASLVAALTPPDWPPPRVIRAARSRDWGALVNLYPALVRSWARAQIGPVVRRVGTQRLLRLRERPAVWLSRRGISVALLGPDGAGKSTLAREVAEGFCFPGTTAYMGMWQGDGDVHHGPWRACRRVLFRPVASLRRYLAARVQQERGRLVVFDRYTYDAYLPPRPPLVRAKKLYFSLLARTCPEPDMLVLLDAPAELLATRKREHTAQELEWQRHHFLGLRERFPGLQVVDAARPQEDVKAEVLDRVWCHYRERRGEGSQ
jgi:thymidylate kinase